MQVCLLTNSHVTVRSQLCLQITGCLWPQVKQASKGSDVDLLPCLRYPVESSVVCVGDGVQSIHAVCQTTSADYVYSFLLFQWTNGKQLWADFVNWKDVYLIYANFDYDTLASSLQLCLGLEGLCFLSCIKDLYYTFKKYVYSYLCQNYLLIKCSLYHHPLTLFIFSHSLGYICFWHLALQSIRALPKSLKHKLFASTLQTQPLKYVSPFTCMIFDMFIFL